MTDRLLYAVPIPSDAQTEVNGRRSQRVAKAGSLASGPARTERVATDPGQRVISGQYRGKYAALMAGMLEELFASDIDAVPFAGRTEATRADGYYALEQLPDDGRLDPREDRLQRFRGRIIKKGTRKSHVRAVQTNPQSTDNPYASGTTTEIAVPKAASDIRWFDTTSGAIESATVQRTQTGEHGDHEIFDTSEPSFDAPALLYALPLADEYKYDARVWDDYDRGKTTTIDGDSVVQWARVYDTAHQYNGNPVLETDLARLTLREGAYPSAARWSTALGSYSPVSLDNGDTWVIEDVDVTRIGQARVDAQVRFRETGQGNEVSLNASAQRGLDSVVWAFPPNESGFSAPVALANWAGGLGDYAGDTGSFTTQTDSGTRTGYRVDATDSSTSEVAIYADQNRTTLQQEDTIRIYITLQDLGEAGISWFVQSPTASDPDRYRATIDTDNALKIQKVQNGSVTTLDSLGPTIATGTRYELTVDTYDSGGNIRADLDQGSTDLAEATAADTTYTSGSFGIVDNPDNTDSVTEFEPITFRGGATNRDPAVPVPAGIRQATEPIALTTDTDPTPTKDLIAREEVRR